VCDGWCGFRFCSAEIPDYGSGLLTPGPMKAAKERWDPLFAPRSVEDEMLGVAVYLSPSLGPLLYHTAIPYTL
jgi:hypothetical protein